MITAIDRNNTPVEKLGECAFNNMITEMTIDTFLFESLEIKNKKLAVIVWDNYFTGLLK